MTRTDEEQGSASGRRGRGVAPEPPLLLSVPDVARALNIGIGYTWVLVRTRQLRSVRIGRRVLVAREEVEAYVAARRVDAVDVDSASTVL